MDYLDTPKQLRQNFTLILGYILVAIAIAIATVLLVNLSYGFGIGKNGQVIQNGLVYFSSQPNPANIYIDGKITTSTTNTRLLLPSGAYKVALTRNGYRNWQRTVIVNGGYVEHFDYPVLFPTTLSNKTVQTYTSAPGLMSESPSRQWVMIQKPGSDSTFDVYNLKTPATPVLSTITLPANLLTAATTSESFQTVGWSDDNQYILLEHLFDGKTEYILVDRADPTQSVNINTTFAVSPVAVTLDNTKYNQYYFYNADGSLDVASLSTPSDINQVAQHVLAYDTYGSNTVVYVTPDGAPSGQVYVKMKVGTTTYNLRTLPTSSKYLINIAGYNSTLYVAVGSSASNSVYIYPDPVGQISTQPNTLPVPIWVLRLPSPNYLSFSDNTQFIMAENGTTFSVYDIQNQLGYNFTNSHQVLDTPQAHATWMDGDRITYISRGKLIVEDYDSTNLQTLVPANPVYLPDFSSNYYYLYTLSPSAVSGQQTFNLIPLLTPSDI